MAALKPAWQDPNCVYPKSTKKNSSFSCLYLRKQKMRNKQTFSAGREFFKFGKRISREITQADRIIVLEFRRLHGVIHVSRRASLRNICVKFHSPIAIGKKSEYINMNTRSARIPPAVHRLLHLRLLRPATETTSSPFCAIGCIDRLQKIQLDRIETALKSSIQQTDRIELN